jgi:hypothetical protein
VTVALDVVPAEVVKGLAADGAAERPMRGGIPNGPYQYHFVAAVFYAASGARVFETLHFAGSPALVRLRLMREPLRTPEQ